MTTLPWMRSFAGRAAICLSALAVAFFCSCERHKPSELAGHGEHSKSGAKEHADKGHAADAAHDAHHHGDAKPETNPATDHFRGGPAPESSAAARGGTPGQFFPSATPTPH